MPRDTSSLRATTSSIAELEQEVAQLREAICSRQLNGVATGLLAERYHCTPDQAWTLLIRLSRDTALKVRDIAQVVVGAQSGTLTETDRVLALQLDVHLPGSRSLAEAAAPQERG